MQIYILLTDKCNLKCDMCIRGRQAGLNLNVETIINSGILNEISEYDIVLTGGEPSLNPQISDIINLFCKNCKKVTITTNGTLNKYIDSVIMMQNLYFQVSIDGDRKMHNNIRGFGTYEKSMETISILDKIGAKYSIASVVNKNNIEAILKLEDELRLLKNIRYWRISYEMPFGSANFKNMLSAEDWNDFVDLIIKKSRLKLKIKKIFAFDIYDKYKDKLDTIIQQKGTISNCGSGVDKIYIYPNLEVYPCTCLTDFPLGSLRKNSLKEILKGEKINSFVNYKVNDEICKSCGYLKYCNGGCIGISYHWYKKIGMGDIRCPKIIKMKQLGK